MTSYADLRDTPAPRRVVQPLWYFEEFDLIGRLGAEDRALVERARPMLVTRGDTLDLRGTGDDVFVVWRGTVHVADMIRSRRVTRALLRPGDVFGACGAAAGNGLAQAAEARDDCALRVLPGASFTHLVKAAPALRHVEEIVGMPAEARLARLFVILARRDVQADGRHVAIALTHTELGRLVGLSDATVRRLLGTWRLYRLLNTRNDGVELCDLAALERIARGESPHAPPPEPGGRALSRPLRGTSA